MNSLALSDRARILELDLESKLKCYMRVGWIRESSGAVVYMVYVDSRYRLPRGFIPANWYGGVVSVQGIIPPGTARPPEFEFVW